MSQHPSYDAVDDREEKYPMLGDAYHLILSLLIV